ncbi:hypothetical protein [Streptomyces sp. HD]|uniref:hypothetical protein n=1 Tax=Streptomyces sp. HD TaxID=3020892 RepID=UPI00232AA953|nr:hypothetical protein [Streptomyces sp. HD]MDC0773202.1 hypothetical protein [Streptomyces sp. HD]
MRIGRSLPCAMLAAALTGCGGPDGGVRVEGPAASTIPWSGPAYMTDWYGRAWQRQRRARPPRKSPRPGGWTWTD